jgi:hypothetical protein
MKKIILMLLCLAPFAGLAQKLDEYKAPNGKTYHTGDTIKIGLGSMPNGDFKYIQVNAPLGFLQPPHRNSSSTNASKDFSLSNVVIKKIKAEKQMSGSDKIIITVKTGGIPTFDIWIIEAIAACEVTPCANSAAGTTQHGSVADELIKLKKLLDDGAITKEEYNAQKKKLLAQ